MLVRVAILAQVACATRSTQLCVRNLSRVLVFLLVAVVGEMAPVVIDSEVKQEFEKFLQSVKGAQAEGRVHKAMVSWNLGHFLAG